MEIRLVRTIDREVPMASTEQVPTLAQTAALASFICAQLAFAADPPVEPGDLAAAAAWHAVAAAQFTVQQFASGAQTDRARAVSAWDTLTAMARVWRDDPDFPADLAVSWWHLPAGAQG